MQLCYFCIKRPILTVFFTILITIGAVYEVVRLPVVTSIESLVRKDNPDRIFYSKFRNTFGTDDAVVIAIGAEEIFSPDILHYINRLTEKFEALGGVESCLSLTTAETIRGLENDFIVEPLFEEGRIPRDPGQLIDIKEKALANPLIVGNLVNETANATVILIRTKSHEDDQAFESRILSGIQHILSSIEPPSKILGPYIAGWPVVDVKMAEYMNKDVIKFVPISAFLMCLIVYMFVGMWSYTAFIMAVMLLSLLWTMAILRLVGGAMSPLTSILPPLIMALSLSDGIHLTTIYMRLRDIDKTIREAWWPCALTSFTTAIGFLSLLISDIPAIRHFGAAAAFGMGIELFLSFTLLISLLPKMQTDTSKTVRRARPYLFSRILDWIARSVPDFKRGVLIITALSVMTAIAGISRLRVDTNMLDYFYESSYIRKSASFVDSFLGGANTIEISLTTKAGNDFLYPENMGRVEHITSWLKARPGITKVIDPNSFLKLMNKAFYGDNKNFYTLPTSREMAAQYLLLYDGDELSHFMTDDREWVRISARTNLHGTEDLMNLYSSLETVLKHVLEESHILAQFTGKTYIFNHMAQDIVSSQIESLALASVIIFGIMFMVLKDVRLGLISIIPNLLPIIGNLAIMGFVGIPINTATAIISAVAIGIAVDDTIHFIVHYKRSTDAGSTRLDAVRDAIIKKGPAAVSTSLVLLLGFGILITSNFVPTAQFGVLCSLIMLMTLLADLFVLPVLLIGKVSGSPLCQCK